VASGAVTTPGTPRRRATQFGPTAGAGASSGGGPRIDRLALRRLPPWAAWHVMRQPHVSRSGAGWRARRWVIARPRTALTPCRRSKRVVGRRPRQTTQISADTAAATTGGTHSRQVWGVGCGGGHGAAWS